MNEKKLWKIEEIWSQQREPESDRAGVLELEELKSVTCNYSGNISRYNSDFHLVRKFNFTPSVATVFTDDYGTYKGLEISQLCVIDKPVYLFDNHNKIIYPFVEIYEALEKQSFSIAHIDAHPDDAKFIGRKPKIIDLADTPGLIEETRISDFFDAVSTADIINRIYRVTHSDSFEFFLPPEEPYVLSLDIDIFGPEGDFVRLEDKISAIKKAWGGAMAVCIATSPGFIDQELARKIIQVFVS